MVMFLKDHPRRKDGKKHHYYSLCETIRTEHGPRHRRVCYLGELNTDAQRAWRKTVEVVDTDGQARQLTLWSDNTGNMLRSDAEVTIRLRGIRWERPREFGAVYTGWMLWKRLGLDAFYRQTFDGAVTRTADVPWSSVAAILAINRLCAPRSELFIDEQWYRLTALDDIVGVPEPKVHKDRLYACLDRLIEKKAELEQHLKAKWGELFKATYDVLLYDLTSTYFEGEALGNSQAKRGYSRDHRPDCKQVIVALIVSEEGFPFAFEVMDGNRRDVTTLEEMLEAVETKYGVARRVWVFDRGVVSEKNLKLLRRRKMPYVCGTPRSALKSFEKELTSRNWERVREDVEIHRVPRVSGEETFLLVRSTGRRLKEDAMRELKMKRLEKSLNGLAQQVKKGRLKDERKIHFKAGQILGHYPSVASLYAINVKLRAGRHLEMIWSRQVAKLRWKQITAGTYLIRTNLSDVELGQLWEIYTQLTEAEAAFRAIKSELMIRPVWHHKTHRVQAHILVAFLGYALWVTLKQALKQTASLQAYEYDTSPWKALKILSRIKSGDIILPAVDGRILRLRRISTPDTEEKELLRKLRITLPDRLSADIVM
ncbi:MAG: IS1634 family transposase [Elusimicrobia bacterium]|nr:IS1634 family transposase [Candidatus Obscuribacterium magneticum]MCB4756376.1 IS1634 family transposase [Candidatus Obscuribacterium magneticum]